MSTNVLSMEIIGKKVRFPPDFGTAEVRNNHKIFQATLKEVIAVQTKRKAFDWQRRLWAIALAAVLACIPMVGTAAAAPATGAVVVPEKPALKPTVSIVGNVVVDKNKPTGFYELSLRVKTPRVITRNADSKIMSEEEYAQVLEQDELNDTHNATEQYTIKNYPFESAAAAVYINLDALWPVTWGTGKPIYDTWEASNAAGTVGSYQEFDWDDDRYAENFPRGIDLNNEDQPKIFTDLSGIIDGNAVSVRLDTAHPDEMTNATALIERVDGNIALLTLTANTTTTNNVVYNTETPVVVVRFAYDMNRFTRLEVGNPTADPVEPNNSDFWLGLDRSNRPKNDQFPLTYLAKDKSMSDGYADSDGEVAKTSVHQSVWYSQNIIDDNANQESTHFYYYLGAEDPIADGSRSYKVVDDDKLETMTLTVPKTEGRVVLAKKDTRPGYGTANDPETGEYSFFQNLLSQAEGTLDLRLVNAETYRKPTGSGGTTILFYDWDDSLIGSLVVDKGDVRAEVNEYVETNLIHPDLRASKLLTKGKVPEEGDPNRTAYANLLDSLEREYTYRGKYAYTVGGDDEALGVDNGTDYPLTNKLDYVFYRRLNRIVEQTDANNATTSYYSTTSLLDENNQDAALYPYVYGWAVVEDTAKKNKEGWKVMYDAAKTEDVWTTIGVGELSDVKPGVGRTDTPFPGTLDIADVTEPAFIAYQTAKLVKKGEAVAVPTQYQYTTASTEANKYFRFADFSDIDGELARYKKANGDNKDTLIVKAVYEPGPALRSGTAYQIAENPTYNKLNEKAADMGGAYSIVITLERANAGLGAVQGVSRVRSPAIRQDTTIDQKWIADLDLGVDHNLSNPSVSIAQGLTETTFTNVDVDNGDLVKFTLSLSARQNRVNYFLTEKYGYNFVSGGQRSISNFLQTGEAFAIDNYNYFAGGDSDEQDIYYDPKDYGDRDGSHGFVLYGTLNSMMQKATEWNMGVLSIEDKSSYLSDGNMRDINLRADSAGTAIDVFNVEELQDKIIAAALACKNSHYGDPDFWNNDLDCAELTYHQLQWYIINGTLYDRTTADDDSHKLTFCHLHASCADLTSTKPKNWDELVAAGREHPEYIDQLSVAEIETMTHLRNSTSGSAFASVRIFKDRFSAAVQAGNTSWVDIQNAILRGSGDINTYWWYDGATSNTSPTSLTALGERAQAALVPQLYPDGVSRTTRSKLESARANFNSNASAGENKVATAWVRMTNNLVKAHQETAVGEGDDMEYIYTHTKFADFDEFLTAYLAALQKAADDDYVYGGDNPPTWEGLQRAILKPGADYNNNPDTAAPEEADLSEFWWKDGKTPLRVVNVKTLLEAARLAQSSDPDEKTQGETALAKVTLDILAGGPYYLRSSKTGEPLADKYPDTDSILAAVKAAQVAGAKNWNTLQYYLIYDTVLTDEIELTKETNYYWWKDGGTGTAIDFSSASNLNQIITRLMDAAFRGDEFGDPAAKQSVTDQLGSESDFFKLTRLTTAYDPENDKAIADLDGYPDTDSLLQAITQMKEFMKGKQGITDPYAMPSVNWYQVQYWILHASDPDPYLVYNTLEYNQAVKDYWWYDLDEKPEEKPPEPEPTEELVGLMEQYLKGEIANFTSLVATQVTNSGLKGKTQTTNLPLASAKNILKNLADDAVGTSYYDAGTGKLNLTWVQIQYYAAKSHSLKANGSTKPPEGIVDHATALANLQSEFGYNPAKFPDNVKLDG